MQLTQAAEYAIRTMLHLSAIPSGATANISAISAAWDIPENFLRKIVSRLTHAGFIESQRGVGGGIQLGQPASSLTLLDVLEVMEGPICLNKCLMCEKACPRDEWCPVHPVWIEAQKSLRDLLGAKTLAELVADMQSRKPHVEGIPV